MNVQLNGKPTRVADGSSIADLIRDNGLDPDTVVVEHNLTIAAATQWDQITLKEGDRLEILRFVGGG